MSRESVPAELQRAVLVEAGHRCAIPTCRATTTEIAHIVPWADVREHRFDNLIALCPTCHARYDQKKEIDRKAMHQYKQNLAVLNGRYSDFEHRVFAHLANTNEDQILLASGMELLVANAVMDGFLKPIEEPFGTYEYSTAQGVAKTFAMTHMFEITPEGKEFVRKFKTGEELG